MLINTQSGLPQSFLDTNYKEIVPFFGFQLICSCFSNVLINNTKSLNKMSYSHTRTPHSLSIYSLHILTVVLRSLQVLHNCEKVSQLKRKVADKSRDVTETSSAKGVFSSEIKAAIITEITIPVPGKLTAESY